MDGPPKTMNIDISELETIGLPLLLVLFLNGIGWLAKESPIPNRYIPHLLCLLGGIIYPAVYDYGKMIINTKYQWLVASIYGCLIGLSAVGTYKAWTGLRGDKTTEPK